MPDRLSAKLIAAIALTATAAAQVECPLPALAGITDYPAVTIKTGRHDSSRYAERSAGKAACVKSAQHGVKRLRSAGRTRSAAPDYADLVKAFELFDEGRVEVALSLVNRFLEKSPDNVDALLLRGYCRLTVRECVRALQDADRVIKLAPRGSEGYFLAGLCHAEMRDLPAALGDFSRAYEVDGTAVTALLERGKIYRQLAQHDKALADLNEVLKKSPDNIDGYWERTLVYMDQKDLKAALADGKKMVELAPEDPDCHRLLAVVYELSGNYKEALSEYRMAGLLYKAFELAEMVSEMEYAIALVQLAEQKKQASR